MVQPHALIRLPPLRCGSHLLPQGEKGNEIGAIRRQIDLEKISSPLTSMPFTVHPFLT
jgi:hypothetical protein